MSTQNNRPLTGKLKREDFSSIVECDREILNLKWMIFDMHAERIAQDKIIAVLGNYDSEKAGGECNVNP